MVDPSQVSFWMRVFGPITRMFGRYAKLESRVTELEKKLEKRSKNECPRCGGLKYFTKETKPIYTKDSDGQQTADPRRLIEYAHTLECVDCKYSIPVRESAYPKK